MIFPRRREQTNVVTVDARRLEGNIQENSPSDEFFRTYAPAVYAYALRRVGSTVSAEDVTAEVFLHAIRDWRRRTQDDPLPWLYGIARRKVADHHRRVAKGKTIQLTESVLDRADLQGFIQESEQANELRRLVGTLAPDQREALLLFYVEELSAERVANAMHRSVAAVNSLLQRARQNLRTSGATWWENER